MQKEKSTAVVAAAAVEILFETVAYNDRRTGAPRLRMAASNTRCFRGEFRVAGMRFVSRTNTQMVSGIPRLYYKTFAETKPVLEFKPQKEFTPMKKTSKTVMGQGTEEPQFAAFVGIDWADQEH